ncbi:MAG: UDP-N-acetylmuramoyl-L-alanine--D-glutamate ligase [Geminicoccaceae bacterium]
MLAPGVPLTHPKPHWTVERAHAAGVEVIGDTELFFREHAASRSSSRILGITGTNGKSTTTALTAHILADLGLRTALGGNIGEAVLGLSPLAATDAYVIELSSYQIDLTPSGRADAAALLNLTPDHLDRHGTMAHYAEVKERLVAAARLAVIGVEDDWCRAIAARRAATGAPLVAISSNGPAEGFASTLFAAGTEVWSASPGGPPRLLGDLAGIGSLRGRHNMQNALAALALAHAAAPDMAFERLLASCRSFPGLDHRMQQVGRIGRVLFVNDSKATNADSTEKALAAFPGGIFWIAGGRPKEGGIAPLAPYFDRIARAYLVGEAAAEFAATLGGRVPHVECGTIARAVALAAEDAARSAEPEPVVLLSPASASFDQFADFEERGRHFKELVARLTAGTAGPGGGV